MCRICMRYTGSRLDRKYEQSVDYCNRILSKHPMEYEARLGRAMPYKAMESLKRL